MKTLKVIKLTILCIVAIVGTIVLFSYGKKLLHKRYELVSIEDCELAVRDYGKGKPTVIIESGLACTKDGYFSLQYDLANHFRVVSYDHAGIGDSSPSSNPRTLPYYVLELRQLLKQKQIDPPYVFIGHSLGGHIIRYYTFLYPEEVLGLVFIDHPHEHWFNYIRENWSEDEIKEYFKYWTVDDTNNMTTIQEEVFSYEKNCVLIEDKKLPDYIPALMFTGNNIDHFRKDDALKAEKDMEAWKEMQYSIISELHNKKQIVDRGAGHWFHNDRPKLVYNEIYSFIENIMN